MTNTTLVAAEAVSSVKATVTPVVLIAEEALPPGLVKTIFDWQPIPAFGFPFWIVISIFLIICTIIVFRYWWKRSARLNSVKGWLESLKKMSQFDVQVWIISRVQKLTIECLYIKDNVLSNHDETQIGMWHVNSSMGIVRVGGNPAVVISEDYDQNRDFLTEIALCHACDYVNAKMYDLYKMLDETYKKAIEKKEITEKTPNPALLCKPIDDADVYDRTGRDLLKNIFPDAIPVPSYNNFNPNRFRKYFPRGCSGMFFGGELIRDAEKLNTNIPEKNWIERNIVLFIAIVFAGMAILVAYYVPLG
jgi:hypothetical protein